MLRRRADEMRIHLRRTGEQGVEGAAAERHHYREANRRPDREAAADPIGQAEDLTLRHAKRARGGRVIGDGDQVGVADGMVHGAVRTVCTRGTCRTCRTSCMRTRRGIWPARGSNEPRACMDGVEQCLGSAKGFGNDDDEGRGCIAARQHSVKLVRVNVGDVVSKGQLLATFAAEVVEAELAQSRASVAEAEAALADAQTNADRASTLDKTGAMSVQQINQYLTAAKTAEARLAAARAMARVSQLRLTNTQVVAPDDGTLSARLATVGAVVQSGQELFRLVRKNRLEWRAEVTSSELAKIARGQKVNVITPAGDSVTGTVRMIAPTVDLLTRNVQVFVDLAPNRHAKAGMFARGEFVLAPTNGLTIPPQAVVVRDGFAYVFIIQPDNRVQQVKVQAGRRFPDSVEIRDGLNADSVIVAQGAGFLNDGDLVKVVPANQPAAKK